MPQSLSEVYIHVIFSTRGRTPWLRDEALRSELHAYMAGVLGRLDSPSLRTGGVEDHAHILLRLGRTCCISDLVREVKRVSTTWLTQRCPTLKDFRWQAGYGAFSISPSHLGRLTEYIATQPKHHEKLSFQDEFRRICDRYGVQLDERHAWD